MKRSWYLGIVPLLLIVPLAQGHSGPASRSGLVASEVKRIALSFHSGPAIASPVYVGPSPDDLTDALDATREAARIAQEAAEAEHARLAEEAAQRAQAAVQRPSAPPSYAPHSDAFWRGLAVCEESGTNHPFYGFFAIIDGSAGGLPWETQVGMANGIIGRYGDRAWAASCIGAGYAASPSG